MVRRYRKRRYGRSTGIIKMKFQSFMDISTSDSSMQIITISAGGPEILRRLSAQFAAYKYYKIGNISVKLVPASTLPVDPTGLSITQGDNLVDPRDQLTPGMMRITNGEDIFEDLTGLSDSTQHEIYNNMLLDPRWFKWMLQSGVKRHATPRYWQIGQLHQDQWPGATINVPTVHYTSNVPDQIKGTSCVHIRNIDSLSDGERDVGGQQTKDMSSPYGFFQTGHRGVLGWLPTDGNYGYNNLSQPLITSPVEVECMKIILPKAYKTRYWYRMFISETVYFREPIVNFGITDVNAYAHRPLDIFHYPTAAAPVLPTDAVQTSFPTDTQTGGNYGDN